MMERLNASDAFMALTKTRLGAARRGRAEAMARVEYLDRREQAADTRRRALDVVHELRSELLLHPIRRIEPARQNLNQCMAAGNTNVSGF